MRLVKRLWAWTVDLLSASYYPGMVDYKDIDPDYKDPNPRRNGEFLVVVKTRGGQQYYQSEASMAWELTWDDVAVDGKIVKYNPTWEMCVKEAESRNHSLSVQRKSVSGAIILFLAFVLEAIVGLDISILTSDASEVTVNVPEAESPSESQD